MLTGDGGGDVFLFDLPNEGRAKITDFHQVEGDKIGIDHMAFGRDLFPEGGFFLPFTFPSVTATATATTDPAALGLQFNTTTPILSFDADRAGTAYSRFDLAFPPGVGTLNFTDFAVI